MATETDQYILKTQGEEELRRLEAAIEANRKALLQMVGTQGPATAQARMLADSLLQLENRYNTVAASVDRLNRATNQAARRSAQSQLGFGAVNMAQDVIQGGPGAAVNNAIFLAQQQGVRSLIGEYVALAGGIGTVTASLGSMAVAAGAAFLVMDNELKKAKLGWEDLDDVVSNLTPWLTLKETVTGIGEIGKGWGLETAIEAAQAATGDFVIDIAKVAVGWDDATEAARRHKEEVEQAARETRELAEATAKLGRFQSEQQKNRAEKGGLIGQAIAEMGGAGGVNAVRDALANAMSGAGGDEKITRGDETKTRREFARDDATRLLGKAASGDETALARLRPMLQAQGFDMKAFDAASEGRDLKKEDEQQREWEQKGKENNRRYLREQEKRMREELDVEADMENEKAIESGRAATEARKRRESKEKGFAGNLQSQFNEDLSLGGTITEKEISRRLQESQGLDSTEADKYAGGVLVQLQKGFDREVRKKAGEMGASEAEARAAMGADAEQKRIDAGFGVADATLNVLRAQQAMREDAFKTTPERIAAVDLARQAESRGAVDTGRQQVEKLGQLVELAKANNDLQKSVRNAAATFAP